MRLPGAARSAAWGLPVALVVTLAAVQPGFPVNETDLNDGSVWITTLSEGKVGRYNKAVAELTNGLRVPGSGLDVLQQAGDIVIDASDGIRVVDPATVVPGSTASLNQETTEVAMGGGNVVVVDQDSGSAWIRPLADLGDLRIKTDAADLELGAGGQATVGLDGTVLAVKGDGSAIVQASRGADGAISTTLLPLPSPAEAGPVSDITAVGLNAYVLRGTWLVWPGHSLDLTEWRELILQQPGPAASSVLIAAPYVLLAVTASGGIETYRSESPGQPARPVYLDGCAHAAWSSGDVNYLRQCGSDEPVTERLQGLTSQANPVFRVNRSIIVLNDTATGNIWLPFEDTTMRTPNWAAIDPLEDNPNASSQPNIDQNQQIDCAEASGPVQAQDDAVGVRRGATIVIPVLANDSAPNCGALAISAPLGEMSPRGMGEATPIYDGRAIQFTASPQATGEISFTYMVSDGRGEGLASTATVTVMVVSSDNQAPRPVATPRLTVEQGATISYDVLDDFVDPDGDPIYVVGASSNTADPVFDQSSDDSADGLAASSTASNPAGPALFPVRFTASGLVTATVTGNETGIRRIAVKVSDGLAAGTGFIELMVVPPREANLELDTLKLDAYVGQTVTVDALSAVRTATVEEVRLDSVILPSEARYEINEESGTFTFTGGVPKTYYVEFGVKAGIKTGKGWARIDVKPYPEESPLPFATADIAYVVNGTPAVIDPLANDVVAPDLVKVLASVDVDFGLPMNVAILDHQFLEISVRGNSPEPLSFTYTMAAGDKTTTGTVNVVVVPPSLGQPPVVKDINATVATGQVVTIPVMDYASDPDGEALSIVPDSIDGLVAGQGMAFVSGNTLRYEAPDSPMTVEAWYMVADPDDHEVRGRVTIRVHQSQGEFKREPTPVDVTARVFQGEKVRIPIPLTGIDVDGDGILLIGMSSAPERGLIDDESSGADFLVYEAFPAELGTDSFEYKVEDRFGNLGTGTIRVGIAARPNISGVVLRDDIATVRPGEHLEMRVLSNDIDSAGGELTLCGRPTSDMEGVKPTYAGRRVVLDATPTAGVIRIEYSACNSFGDRGTAVLVVTVDPDADFKTPIAKDFIIRGRDTIERDSIDIPVLSLATNPSGPLSDLAVSVPSMDETIAHVNADKSITVNLQPDRPMTFAYELQNTRPEAEGKKARAYITVPALGKFDPMNRFGAKPLEILAGEELIINLIDYVQVVPGKRPHLLDPDTPGNVTARGADPTKRTHIGTDQLAYTSTLDFAGPTAVSFEVTDFEGDQDEHIRTVHLQLRIMVLEKGASSPEFFPTSVSVVRGEAPASIDLGRCIRLRGASDLRQVRFSQVSTPASGLTVSLAGSVLTISAAESMALGPVATPIRIEAYYPGAPAVQGQVAVTITETDRGPITLGQIGQVIGNYGERKTIDILNYATDPFYSATDPNYSKAANLTVLPTVMIEPADVATVSLVGHEIVIDFNQAASGTGKVRFEVGDKTGRAERVRAGSFLVSVRSKPDAPEAPTLGAPGDGQIAVSWNPPDSHGAPIDEYRVTVSSGRTQVCPKTYCVITGLDNGKSYSFTIAAHNEVGWSPESLPSKTEVIDVDPPPPATAPTLDDGDGFITISWPDSAAGHSSAIARYVLMIKPDGGSSFQREASRSPYTLTGLTNGTGYTVTVVAINSTGRHSSESLPAKATPAAKPGELQIESITKSAEGQFDIRWSQAAANGDNPTYQLKVSGGGSGERSLTDFTTSLSGSLAGAKNWENYEFWVVAQNRKGETSSARLSAMMWATPDQVGSLELKQVREPGDPWPALGHATIEANWSRIAVGGLPVTYTVTLAGPTTAGPEDQPGTSKRFENVRSGRYTITVVACVSATDITGFSGGSDATLCSTTTSEELSVSTLPGRPALEGTLLSRADEDGAIVIHQVGAYYDGNGTGAIVQHALQSSDPTCAASAPDPASTAWHAVDPLPMAIPSVGDEGGCLWLRVKTDIGLGPPLGAPYPAYTPPPPPTTDPPPTTEDPSTTGPTTAPTTDDPSTGSSGNSTASTSAAGVAGGLAGPSGLAGLPPPSSIRSATGAALRSLATIPALSFR